MNDIIKSVMIDEIITEINMEQYNEFIRERCEHYLKNITFKNEIKNRYNKGYISECLFKNKSDRCEACVYNDGCIRRCSNKKKNGDLCLKHHNIKNKYGYLIFGDINNDYRKNIRYNSEKCCAITFKNGVIDQCCKNKKKEDLCNMHLNYKNKYGRLKYGSI